MTDEEIWIQAYIAAASRVGVYYEADHRDLADAAIKAFKWRFPKPAAAVLPDPTIKPVASGVPTASVSLEVDRDAFHRHCRPMESSNDDRNFILDDLERVCARAKKAESDFAECDEYLIGTAKVRDEYKQKAADLEKEVAALKEKGNDVEAGALRAILGETKKELDLQRLQAKHDAERANRAEKELAETKVRLEAAEKAKTTLDKTKEILARHFDEFDRIMKRDTDPKKEPVISDIKDAKLGDTIDIFLDETGKISTTPTSKTVPATVVAIPKSASNPYLACLGWKDDQVRPTNSNLNTGKQGATAYCHSSWTDIPDTSSYPYERSIPSSYPCACIIHPKSAEVKTEERPVVEDKPVIIYKTVAEKPLEELTASDVPRGLSPDDVAAKPSEEEEPKKSNTLTYLGMAVGAAVGAAMTVAGKAPGVRVADVVEAASEEVVEEVLKEAVNG